MVLLLLLPSPAAVRLMFEDVTVVPVEADAAIFPTASDTATSKASARLESDAGSTGNKCSSLRFLG